MLITGAAGSIGSELVRQAIRFQPEKLILVDQAETPMHDLQLELNAHIASIEFIIGDVCNEIRMEKIFATFRPTIVFHAAAYKHVPMMEDNPSEAILTNIKGTKVMADLSQRFAVDRFVLVSTDKAVNPSNIMGCTKRAAELYCQAISRHVDFKTKFITTRFGNVLGSNGSVIPLFKKQIAEGGPVTITHPDITRFFMTIPEACQLVLEAAQLGQGGEIYVFDMGESVKIADLAHKMIQLSGKEVGKDIEIKYTGLRPGEKLYEELLAQEENTLPTHHPKILIGKVKPSDPDFILEKINLLCKTHRSLPIQNSFRSLKSLYPSTSATTVFTPN